MPTEGKGTKGLVRLGMVGKGCARRRGRRRNVRHAQTRAIDGPQSMDEERIDNRSIDDSLTDAHAHLVRSRRALFDPERLLLARFVGEVDRDLAFDDDAVEPFMAEHLLRRRALVRVEVEHRL